MDESRKVIRIFLASPGDLKDERAAAKQAVDELNQSWLAHHGYHVELVGWELTVAAIGRPQALINEDLASCEYFIGVVWKRWGTPPGKDGKYQSGFEEEFQTSLERYRASGKPGISLFFKTLTPQDKQDPGPQLQQVIDFKKDIVDRQELLYEEFNSVADFEGRIRRSVFAYVRGLIRQVEAASDSGRQSSGIEAQAAPSLTMETPQDGLFSLEGATFLHEFVAKTDRAEPENPPTPVEVARFRLLGTLLAVDDDDPLIAVHDANRIFMARDDLDLGVRERRGLMDAGLAEYEHENVPLFHWLAPADAGKLLWRSIGGRNEAVKTGALAVMRDLGEPVHPTDSLSRSTLIEFWFTGEASTLRRTAALRYLADHGVPDDVPTIQAELDRKDLQTASAATDAVIRIRLRESRQKAFAAVLELQPETMDEQLLDELMAEPSGIENDQFLAGVVHRSAAVRIVSVRELISRDALAQDLAERLLEDGSLFVRLEVMKSLTSRGRVFSEEEKTHLLVKRDPVGLFGIGRSTPNDDRLQEFRDWERESAPDDDLEATGSVFDRDGEFVLDERRFSRRGADLRRAVADQYKQKFESAVVDLFERHGTGGAVEETRKLESFLRQKHTRKGLDILCRRGGPGDLAVVRAAMDSGFLGYSDDEVRFLRRNGEWDDVPRLIAAVERSWLATPRRNTLLGAMPAVDDGKYAVAASAIAALGRRRENELMALTMSDRLRRQIIVEMTNAGFTTLADTAILECFRSKDAGVRKAAALKAVQATTKARQKVLLAQYLAESYRFYNVLVWLDLGVSLPRETARAAAERIMARTWR